MKRSGIFSDIALACGLGLLVAGVEAVFYFRLSSTAFLRGALVLSQFVYCGYLLCSLRPRIGSLTLFLVQAAAGLGLYWMPTSDGWFLIAWTLCLSSSRILLLRENLLTAGLDLATALAGILFFSYLLQHSGSLAQGVWGFFLLQAAAGLIPKRIGSSTTAESFPDDPFQASVRQARNAIERLQGEPF